MHKIHNYLMATKLDNSLTVTFLVGGEMELFYYSSSNAGVHDLLLICF